MHLDAMEGKPNVLDFSLIQFNNNKVLPVKSLNVGKDNNKKYALSRQISHIILTELGNFDHSVCMAVLVCRTA